MPLSPQVLFANLDISDYIKFDIFYLCVFVYGQKLKSLCVSPSMKEELMRENELFCFLVCLLNVLIINNLFIL